MTEPIRPFQISKPELEKRIEEMVDVTFSDITSQFLLMPKGNGFIEYSDFSSAYEVLKRITKSFRELTVKNCLKAMEEDCRVFGVIRAVLGLTAPEWADLAAEENELDLTQNAVRTLDRLCREDSKYYSKYRTKKPDGITIKRVFALVTTAIKTLNSGVPETSDGVVHRLSKIDTVHGFESLIYCADEQVPYAALLYERYLGRPFASHRDAVSELVGEVMELAIEEKLREHGITYRKTGRAERIPGFGQAPDFCIPDEFSPAVIIEAKITSDDGTARDKVARIKELETQRNEHVRSGKMKAYQVIACIDGRGFKQRREDMRQLLIRLDGKVFTSKSLDQLVLNTNIQKFITKKKTGP